MAQTSVQRPDYLGHHYDSVEQQFQSGKLGMWLFLATEILLFAGLFCAYAVYRRNHPEIFLYAHHFLDTTLGGVNTIVLIFSSVTMAIGVRCAQKGQRGMLVLMLSITFLCACTFLGIKYVEYSHKWKHGLLWGTLYEEQVGHGAEHGEGAEAGAGHGADATHGAETTGLADVTGTEALGHDAAMTAADDTHATGEVDLHAGEAAPVEIVDAKVAMEMARAANGDHTGTEVPAAGSLVPRAATAPAGLASGAVADPAATPPPNVHIFFGIYFVMTGLHGLHVVIGMIVIGWLIVRSLKGHFGPDYFTPVDLGGLYWHIVDLIWIYLFPLLYLIH